MKDNINNFKVRFAPSPTGPLHLGGLRIALINYFFTKKNNGAFMLRIEDTDKNRFIEGSESHILDSLKWCGIEINNKIYKQSERLEFYNSYIEKMIENGDAYYCYDSKEDIERIKKQYELKNIPFIYNHKTRHQLKNTLNKDFELFKNDIDIENKVVRFKTPLNSNYIIKDEFRGNINIDTSLLDDKILIKSDGFPTYHFANVIDDHLMKITHVIRGEEWLPSLALHQMIYEKLNFITPKFYHTGLILKSNGKGKLSKRDAQKEGFPVYCKNWKYDMELSSFEEQGIIKESLINYLITLGWGKSEEEIMDIDELMSNFNINQLNFTGCKFDYTKLIWFNHKHLQYKKPSFFLPLLRNITSKYNISIEQERLIKIIELIKPRLNTLNDLEKESVYLFIPPTKIDINDFSKIKNHATFDIIEKYFKSNIEKSNIEKDLSVAIQKEKINKGILMKSLRILLVGHLFGIGINDIINILDLEDIKGRIDKGIQYIKNL